MSWCYATCFCQILFHTRSRHWYAAIFRIAIKASHLRFETSLFRHVLYSYWWLTKTALRWSEKPIQLQMHRFCSHHRIYSQFQFRHSSKSYDAMQSESTTCACSTSVVYHCLTATGDICNPIHFSNRILVIREFHSFWQAIGKSQLLLQYLIHHLPGWAVSRMKFPETAILSGNPCIRLEMPTNYYTLNMFKQEQEL